MAAFSNYLDSNIYLPNMAPTIMMDDVNFTSNCFSQFYSPELFEESILEQPNHHESSCVDHFSNSNIVSVNDPSVVKLQTTGRGDSTMVADKLENCEQVTQNASLRNRKKRTRNVTALNSAKSKEKKKCNVKKSTDQEPPKGYTYVRARRGEATDSHSLAERVRRKKISERMKILQCLVPGCDKVNGKAFMLDEIINYVQSLQNQVEFLSMELTSVNSMFYDFGVDLEGLMVKPERVREKSEESTTTAVACLQEKNINPTQASAFVDSTTATFALSHNYPLLQYYSHAETPIVFSQPQDNGSILWDVDISL